MLTAYFSPLSPQAFSSPRILLYCATSNLWPAPSFLPHSLFNHCIPFTVPPLFVSVCFFFLLLAVLSCFQPVYSAIALALLFQSQILHHFPFVSDSRRSGYTCKTEVVKCCWASQDQSGLYKQYCLTLCIYVYVKDIPPDHVNEVKMWQLEK